MAEKTKTNKPLSFSARAIEYGMIAFDSANIVSILLLNYAWPSSTVAFVRALLDWVDFIPSNSPVWFITTWTLAACICIGAVATAGVVARMVRTGRVNHMWLVHMLRTLVRVLVTVFFLPIMEIVCLPFRCGVVREKFLPDYTCWNGAHVVMPLLSVVVLLLFVPLCLAMSASYFDNDPFSGSPMARPSGRFDFAFTFARTIMVLLTLLLSSDGKTTEAVIVAVLMVALAAYVPLKLPYYVRSTNQFRSSLLFIVAWVAVFSIPFSTGALPERAGVILAVFALVSLPFVAVAGALAPLIRFRKLEAIAQQLELRHAQVQSLDATPALGSVFVQMRAEQLRNPGSSEAVGVPSLKSERVRPLPKSSTVAEPPEDGFSTSHTSMRPAKVRQLAGPSTRSTLVRSHSASSTSGSRGKKNAGLHQEPREGTSRNVDVASLAVAGASSTRSMQTSFQPLQLSVPLQSDESFDGMGTETPTDSASAPNPAGSEMASSLSFGTKTRNPTDNADNDIEDVSLTRVLDKGSSFIERVRSRPESDAQIKLMFASDVEILVRFFTFRTVVDARALRTANDIYRQGLRLFPWSSYLSAQYAAFLMYNRKDNARAFVVLGRTRQLSPPFDVRYLIYASARFFEQNQQATSLGTGGLTTVSMLEYRQTTTSAFRYHRKTLRARRKLWKLMSRAHKAGKVADLDTHRLHRYVSSATTAHVKASDAYNRLLASFGKVPAVLRAVATFRMATGVPKHLCSPLLRRADLLEERQGLVADRGSDIEQGGSATTDTESQGSSLFSSTDTSQEGASSRPELVPHSNEFRAIRALRAMLFIVLVLVAGSFTFQYTETRRGINQLAEAVELIEQATLRTKDIALAVSEAQYAVLAAKSNATIVAANAQGRLLHAAKEFQAAHDSLYLKPRVLAELDDLYVEPSISLQYYREGCLPARAVGACIAQNRTENLWIAGLSFSALASRVATLPLSDMEAALQTQPLRFILDNALQTLFPQFKRGTDLYVSQVFQVASENDAIQVYLLIGNEGLAVVLLGLIVYVMFPVVKTMRHKTEQLRAIVNAIPRSVCRAQLKALAAHVAEADELSKAAAPAASNEATSTMVVPHAGYGESDGSRSGASQSGLSQSASFPAAGLVVEKRRISRAVAPRRSRADRRPGNGLVVTTSGRNSPSPREQLPTYESTPMASSRPRRESMWAERESRDSDEDSNASSLMQRAVECEEKDDESSGSDNDDDKSAKQTAAIWIRALGARTFILFLAISGLAAVGFFLNTMFVDRAKFFSADIRYAGLRRVLGTDIATLAREVVSESSSVFPTKSERLARLLEAVELFESVHVGLIQGDDDRNLLGSDNRDPRQDALLYRSNCFRANCTAVDTRTYATVAKSGVHQLLWEYARVARALYDEALHNSSEAERNYHIVTQNTKFAFVSDVATNDLSAGLGRSSELYSDEALAYVDWMRQISVITVVGVILALAAIYGSVYRSMSAILQQAGMLSFNFLSLLPQEVIYESKSLRKYYVAAQTS